MMPGFAKSVSVFMVEVLQVFYYFDGFVDDVGGGKLGWRLLLCQS